MLVRQGGKFDDTPVIIAVLTEPTGQIDFMPSGPDDVHPTPGFEPGAQVGTEPIPYAVAIQSSVRLRQASDGVVNNDKISSSPDHRSTRANGKILAAVRQAPPNRRFGPLGEIETVYRLLCGNQITHLAAEMDGKPFRMRGRDD